ncbi:MAG: hypothetical protein AAB494_01215 [Patescibacteria group bacterium]
MDDSDVKKAKVKVVDIIKKLDVKGLVSEPVSIKQAEKKPVKKPEEKTTVKSGKIISPLSWAESRGEGGEELKNKNNDLEKLFEKIDRKEQEVLGRKASPQMIEKEIPHLRQDSINISLPPRLPEMKFNPRKKWVSITWILGAVVLGFGVYGAYAYLPKADIKISIKKFPWEYDNPMTLSSKLTDIDLNSRQIPVAIFSQRKNINFPFPATGKKYVERKASGGITIYNNFSTEQQILVSGTRFKAPDGKIFKLLDRITVPGARVENGQVVAASIEAQVAAEKPGEAYNIGSVSKFTIPGFEGTLKFDKFYAESKSPIAGGFVGQAAYPTDADIKNAKGEAEKNLKNGIEVFIVSQIPSDEFKLIDSSRQFNVLKETVNTDTDENSNFYVFVDGEMSMTAFKKVHIINLLTQMAKQVVGTSLRLILKEDEYSISYGNVQIDPKTKIMTLPVKFKGTFWEPLDVNSFRQKISGKSEAELKSLIYSYPNIEKADFSFWPFWVSKIPLNQGRVNVIIN